MSLKAEFPEFIDSGAGYSVTDVSGWGTKAAGLAAGSLLATVAVGTGYYYGKQARSWLANTAAGASSGASDSNGGFDFS